MPRSGFRWTALAIGLLLHLWVGWLAWTSVAPWVQATVQPDRQAPVLARLVERDFEVRPDVTSTSAEPKAPPRTVKPARPAKPAPAPIPDAIQAPAMPEAGLPEAVEQQMPLAPAPVTQAPAVATPAAAVAAAAPKPNVPPAAAEAPALAEVAYLKTVPPVYPRAAREADRQGRVLLQVLVDEAGRSAKVEVVESSGHADLDAAAIEAVKQWLFVPARVQGRTVQALVLVPVRFALRR